jgi:hypothetical protein
MEWELFFVNVGLIGCKSTKKCAKPTILKQNSELENLNATKRSLGYGLLETISATMV